MRHSSLTTLCFATLLCVAMPLFASASTLKTLRGADVEIIIDYPEDVGPRPAVILAPGQGYHARLPLMEKLAKDLATRGIVVIRFNWAYFTKYAKSGKPSGDLSQEVEDMQTVVSAAKTMPRIDAKRIAVAGKSLGSLVGWRVFRDDPALLAGVLLTPVCVDMTKEEPRDAVLENYLNLKSNSRPLFLLAGEIDSLCPSRYLYNAAAQLTSNVRVSVIGGAHSFETKDGPSAKKESEANLDLAVRLSSDFVVAKLLR
jgi:dienelactone hydrolase